MNNKEEKIQENTVTNRKNKNKQDQQVEEDTQSVTTSDTKIDGKEKTE